MVTDFPDHWCDGQETSYPENPIYVEPDLPDPAPTLFVKLDNQGKVERIARGSVRLQSSAARNSRSRRFGVRIEEDSISLSDPDWQIAREFTKSGWYCERKLEPRDVSGEPLYVLVTAFCGHWEYVERSSFPRGMITVPDPLQEELAVFLRYGRMANPQGWIGKISKISPDGDKVVFWFEIYREANEQEVVRATHALQGRKQGWHAYPSQTMPEERFPVRDQLQIPFIEAMLNAQITLKDFEKFCYWLLRLLGVHDLYAVKSDSQAGHSDGFFMLGNLAVLYDATLSSDFETRKKQQIENYVHQLWSGAVQVRKQVRKQDGSVEEIDRTFLTDRNKQVWILTRGRTRFISGAGKNDVEVKEVYVGDLVELFQKRILEGMTLDELEEALRRLGR